MGELLRMNADWKNTPPALLAARPRVLRSIVAVGAVMAASLLLLPAMSAQAHNPTGPAPAEAQDDIDNPAMKMRQSLDYLMTQYGVSEEEALRRMHLQSESADIVASVRNRIGDELLDVWLDQDGGGRLTLLTSDPGAAQAAAALVDANPADTAFVKSAYTAVQLKAAQTKVQNRLKGVADVGVSIDARNQSIVVSYTKGDMTAFGRIKHLVGTDSGTGVPVNMNMPAAHPDSGRQKSGSCVLHNCDPAIRGGLQLTVRRDDGSWGSCTSGFLFRASTGAPSC